MVAHLIYLTSLQMRALLECFLERLLERMVCFVSFDSCLFLFSFYFRLLWCLVCSFVSSSVLGVALSIVFFLAPSLGSRRVFSLQRRSPLGTGSYFFVGPLKKGPPADFQKNMKKGSSPFAGQIASIFASISQLLGGFL